MELSYFVRLNAMDYAANEQYKTIVKKLASSFAALAFTVLIVTAALQPFTGTAASHPRNSPSHMILHPSSVPSQTVQVAYYLIGPFGGYRTSMEPKADLNSFEIDASVEGRAATEIRMLIYAPGCEFQTVVLPLEADSKMTHEFYCKVARSVRLSGRIVPHDLGPFENTKVVISYRAFWAHDFFGIADGMVTGFRVAAVHPDANGAFQVDLPYFKEDTSLTSEDAGSPSMPRANLSLVLDDSETGNSVADLMPVIQEFRSTPEGLQVRANYPSELEFAPAR